MITDFTKEHPDRTLWRFWIPMMFSVAYLLLLLVHFTVLYAPDFPLTFAFNLWDLFIFIVFLPEIVIFVTGFFVAVSLFVAFAFLLFFNAAVITTLLPPVFFLNVTTPLLFTVATFLLQVLREK